MLPIVAALLSQGLGMLGNAVLAKGKDAIEEKLGINIEEAMQTPEGLQELRQKEFDHEEFLINTGIKHREIDLQEKALDIDNTKNARDTNTKIQESANASWLAKNTIYIIAFIVILGGGAMLAISEQADVRMAAVSAITLVLGFFFGTTNANKTKDTTIETLSRGLK
jgi:ABC-type multidrug transport system fused ATPase/permease subunit